LFQQEGYVVAELIYVFCSDEFLLDMNTRFLKHDYFTDIITFNLGDPAGDIVGEVYISVDRIKANAKDYDVSQEEELRRVMFHGALHLCGYGDLTKRQKEVMRSKEDKYLELYASEL
jgi:rRNA maturation RNase YbeY